MDYLNAIQIYEQSYSINNNQEEVVEKLASSLVDARLNKKADLFYIIHTFNMTWVFGWF